MPALLDILAEHKDDILAQWLEDMLDTYALDTAAAWRRNRDPFTNPVRRTFEDGLRGVVEALLTGPDAATAAAPHLDAIVRVRAVQDFAPAQAVAFVFGLKKVVRETLWPQVAEGGLFVELLALETAIDGLAQLAFDIHARCRETLFQLRVGQVKSRYDRLLKRANLVCDFSPDGEEP